MSLPNSIPLPSHYRRNNKYLTAAFIAVVVVIYTLTKTTKTTTTSIITNESTQQQQQQQQRRRTKSLSRSFPSWQSTHGDEPWCITTNPPNDKQTPMGLIYVKSYKTGSSTVAGVAKRISRRHASPTTNTECLLRWKHTPAHVYRHRSKNKSFLFGSVRHPSKRAVSHVFFEYVSRKGEEPTDDAVIERLRFISEPFPLRWTLGNDGAWRREKWASFQLAYNSMRDPDDLHVSHMAFADGERTIRDWEEEIVAEIFEEYDFMIVSERMNESLVVLQLLLGLDVGDILFLKSKVAGDQYSFEGGGCVILQKPPVTPAVKEFLNSEEWMWRTSGDLLLYTIANRCLDETIESLGRERFQKALDDYNNLLAKAEEECAAAAVFPCDSNGVFQEDSKIDCEMGDKGCGLRCLDHLSAQANVANSIN